MTHDELVESLHHAIHNLKMAIIQIRDNYDNPTTVLLLSDRILDGERWKVIDKAMHAEADRQLNTRGLAVVNARMFTPEGKLINDEKLFEP